MLHRSLAGSGPRRLCVRIVATCIVAARILCAILGRLGARNHWRAILDEYRNDTAPVTPLGEQEALWRAEGPQER